MTKDNNRNKRYSKLEKEKLIRRLLPPESISVTELSKETGISKSTLQTWKTQATKRKDNENNNVNKLISSKDRFLLVMEIYLLSEAELSRHCGENDPFLEDAKKWQNACINSINSNVDSDDVKELKNKQQNDARKLKL